MGGLPSQSGTASLADVYPPYLSDIHAEIMVGGAVNNTTLVLEDEGEYAYNAKIFVEQAIDSNPYTEAMAYDPADAIAAVQTQIDALGLLMADFIVAGQVTDGEAVSDSGGNEMQLAENFLTKAAAIFADLGINSAFEDIAADTLEESTRLSNQFDAAMYNINAITTSPYVIGVANLANGRTRILARLAAEMERMMYGTRTGTKAQFLTGVAQLMDNMLTRDVGFAQMLAGMTADQSRFDYVSNKEYAQQDLEYDIGEVTWELEALKYRAEFMQAIVGVPLVQKKPSQLSTAISTALSVGPQIGIAIGNAAKSPALGLLAGLGGGALAALAGWSSAA
jgi:hypothetical protein